MRYLPDRKTTSRRSRCFVYQSARATDQPKTVQHLIRKYIIQAGLDRRKISTHKLRHTAATLMYQYGEVDMRSLQTILGPPASQPKSTHINNASLHHAVEQNPLSRVRAPLSDDSESGQIRKKS